MKGKKNSLLDFSTTQNGSYTNSSTNSHYLIQHIIKRAHMLSVSMFPLMHKKCMLPNWKKLWGFIAHLHSTPKNKRCVFLFIWLFGWWINHVTGCFNVFHLMHECKLQIWKKSWGLIAHLHNTQKENKRCVFLFVWWFRWCINHVRGWLHRSPLFEEDLKLMTMKENSQDLKSNHYSPPLQ